MAAGERTPGSYEYPSLKGLERTATQPCLATWVPAFGDPTRPSINPGIKFLTNTQYADGTWNGDQYTGTGFPKVYYMRYEYYRINWPLISLAEYKESLTQWNNRPTT